MKSALSAAVFWAVMSSVPAHAVNLVTNPGFETGDLTGWSVVGPGPSVVFGAFPHSGAFHWSSGAVGSPDTLSQTIATSLGDSYTFSFYLRNHVGGNPNSWEVQWNGVALDGEVDTGSFDYTLKSYTVIGTGSDTIAFVTRHDPASYLVDDVSVEFLAAAEVPEPASLALLGLAITGLAAARRRRV